MSRNRPRREMHFPVVQQPYDTNYVPTLLRDDRLLAHFEGGPRGIRIMWQQHVGTEAMRRTFADITSEGIEKDVESMAEIFAVTSMGTAYHTVALSPSAERMYFKSRLPETFDPDSSTAITNEALVERSKAGLVDAAKLALDVYELLGSNSKITDANESYGRGIADTGLVLAAISADVSKIQGSEVDVQRGAWEAGMSSYMSAIELSGRIGTRPTVAQFADSESPLRRYLYDARGSVTETVYDALVDNINTVTSERT